MCGIAGFVNAAPHAWPDSVVEQMAQSIAHRGPDGFGYYRDAHCALGHRRLSIIDLAGGHQPMHNEDRTLHISYNGEIFNHADLRPELERAGHRYGSRCDTETIVHAYEQYGPASLEHYRGMFSFAIWDAPRKALFAARDRLGIKPFYYFKNDRLLVFGSEIKALLQHPAISASFDESTLPEYLAFGYLSDDRTMFAGIRQLMPGHWLKAEVRGDRLHVEIQQYWDAPKGPVAETQSEEHLIAECRRRLEETVRMRLMSDVPLGMFLSGGVDSSAIAALIRRMSNGPVKTFAVGYQEAPFSELSYASQVAKHLGTEHSEVTIGAGEFFEALPRLIWHEDEPVTWPSSVSLYFVSQLAAQQVKVVLTGEGSDELFGGYGRYRFYLNSERWMQAYGVVPSSLRRGLRGFIASSTLLNRDVRRKLQHTVLGRAEGFLSMYVDNFFSAFSESEQEGLLGKRAASPYENYLRHFEAAKGGTLLSRLLYTDQKTYLMELLRKQDRMSMACSIESRVPFLDHHYVAFAHSVPDGLKIRGKESKYILKRAVEDLLPHDIIYRPKMGFPTPLRQWLAEEPGHQVMKLLRDKQGLVASYLEAGALERLFRQQEAGVEDATDRIWRLLNLQLWGNVFLKGERDLRWAGSLAPA